MSVVELLPPVPAVVVWRLGILDQHWAHLAVLDQPVRTDRTPVMGHPTLWGDVVRWWPSLCAIPVHADDPFRGLACPNKCPCCLVRLDEQVNEPH
ncbi:hypothetical protein [Actinophytocola sp.]|uniref:hypothetical protein n=1 Tax=Actinophytocola sp. TaxID=1872138 RepID=UPI003899905B